MIKEFNEIRIKQIDVVRYEAIFYNADGQRSQDSLKLNAYQIAFLDSELSKRNKKIRQANADKAQGRLV